METLVLVVTVIVALLLGIVVLIQNPKGGGLGAGFQGAAQVGGVQRTADFLEKATWYLGMGLFVLCLVAAIMNKSTVVEPEPTEQSPDQPADSQ
ncbi:MAG: preprotein translocase subunit SecG [Bacteroidota bacterium]|jgi:preprotein translocase subunit SecG